MKMDLVKMDLMKKKKRKGFTLIELIVVIAIIGILAAIAVPRFAGFQSDAKAKADIASLKNISNAVSVVVTNGTITADTVITATISKTTGEAVITASVATVDAPLIATAVSNIVGTVKFQSAAAIGQASNTTIIWNVTAATGAILKSGTSTL